MTTEGDIDHLDPDGESTGDVHAQSMTRLLEDGTLTDDLARGLDTGQHYVTSCACGWIGPVIPGRDLTPELMETAYQVWDHLHYGPKVTPPPQNTVLVYRAAIGGPSATLSGELLSIGDELEVLTEGGSWLRGTYGGVHPMTPMAVLRVALGGPWERSGMMHLRQIVDLSLPENATVRLAGRSNDG